MFITAWARKQVADGIPIYQIVLTIHVASLQEDIDTDGADETARVLGEQALDAVKTLEGEIGAS